MNRFLLVALALSLVTSAGLGMAARVQQARLAAAEERVVTLQGQLAVCRQRLGALLADRRDDREIDALPDTALRDAPDEWMRLYRASSPC